LGFKVSWETELAGRGLVIAGSGFVFTQRALDLNIKNNDNYYNYDYVEKRGFGGD
jgi:hypothetical protein